MLDLQTGVHFQEIKTLVFADDKFDRAGRLIIHRLGQLHGLLAHRLARLVADERAWRFFDHLLVTALDGAFALIQVDDIAVAIADQLDFNVARFLDKFFDEHAVVTKAVARFVAAAGEAFKRFLVVESDAQALAAAACAGLDHDRIANALGNFNRFFRRFNRVIDAGNAVHTRRACQLFRFDLVAHGGNRIMFGTDEDDAFFFNPLGEA